MESRIKVRASIQEMEELFNTLSIRHYKEIEEDIYDVLIRHTETPQNLKGTYTPKQLRTTLRTMEVKPTEVENTGGVRKIDVDVLRTKEGLYRMSMYINGQHVATPNYVDYNTLKGYIRKNYNFQILNVSALEFKRYGDREFAEFNNYKIAKNSRLRIVK